MKIFVILTIAGLTSLPGCQTLATAGDVPAVLDNANAVSRAAVQHAVNSALNTTVLFDDEALTTSSLLSIERSGQRSMQGAIAQGRIMDKPFQFQLVLSGTDCVLIDRQTGLRYLLEDTTCIAE